MRGCLNFRSCIDSNRGVLDCRRSGLRLSLSLGMKLLFLGLEQCGKFIGILVALLEGCIQVAVMEYCIQVAVMGG